MAARLGTELIPAIISFDSTNLLSSLFISKIGRTGAIELKHQHLTLLDYENIFCFSEASIRKYKQTSLTKEAC
jgi:hypothetical protein